MSYTTFAVVWLASGFLSFPLLLWIVREHGETLKANAVDILAGSVILVICTVLGVVSLLFCIALPLIPKRPHVLGSIDSDEDAIIHMRVKRAEVDERLQHEPHPLDWPSFQLWMTREAALLNAVDALLWKADAEGRDLSNDELVSKVSDEAVGRLREALSNPTLLAAQVSIAADWTRKDMERAKRENYPHPGSWGAAVTQQELNELGTSLKYDGLPSRPWCDWRKLKGRMLPGDSVLRYDNRHRAGVVLTRGLQPIAHVNLEWRCYH